MRTHVIMPELNGPQSRLTEITDPPISHAIRAKPQGLWYSVDGSWEDWCETEMPHWISGQDRYEIALGDENMLFITSSAQLTAFSEEFVIVQEGYESRFLRNYHIDWPRVAKKWDGIEIAPYQWTHSNKYKYMWYYGWDCASGVIWRPKGATVTFKDVMPVIEREDSNESG